MKYLRRILSFIGGPNLRVNSSAPNPGSRGCGGSSSPSQHRPGQCSVLTTPAWPSDVEGGAHCLSLHPDTPPLRAQASGPHLPTRGLTPSIPPFSRDPSLATSLPPLPGPPLRSSRRKGRGWASLLPVTERTTLYGAVTWKGCRHERYSS